MEEKFKSLFTKALKLVSLELRKSSTEQAPQSKTLRLKLMAELLKEQVPHENTSYTAR